MKKKFPTNTDLMRAIHKEVVESHTADDALAILDYFLPEDYCVCEIANYQFDFIAAPNFGGNEGIYIDCWLSGIVDSTSEPRKVRMGTYKTLRDDLEAAMLMGKLAGALMYFDRKYVNAHLDEFDPTTD